ncbi:MAG: carbohydrate-binding domain-containing protein [Bacteroidaceae bacterium]|nr:carbohydrate-binding domain-containing protein [Bacteroidaceae bacterium]
MAGVLPTKFYVWQGDKATEYDIDSDEMTFGDGTVTIKGTTYQLADIDSITFGGGAERVAADTVYVTFDGTSATVTPSVEGVTSLVEGADVTLTNTNEDREMCFVLSGSSPSGQFVYNGTYKTTIRLNGLSLTGSTAAAIHIKCGKRIALELADGTVNTLADASEDGGQKAAFYTKGHLEVSGGGTLNLTGNIKHGLSSNEYMLVKKTAGAINVLKAANDGIHAGQYYKQNGGMVTISGVGGDGIQAEATGDEGDEDDGQLIINGGAVNVTLSASDAAALKSDSLMTLTGGTFTLTTKGDADKGLKSKTDIAISGGTFVITQSGSYLVEDYDPSYTTAVKADGNITITGGTFTLTSSATAGKGLSADGDITVSEDDATVVLNITNTGAGEVMDTSKNTSSEEDDDPDAASYRVYVSVPTSNGGGGRWGGTTYTIKSGTFTGPTSGTPYFYAISSSYSTSGSTRTYSLSDVTSTYASATLTNGGSTSSDDNVTSTGIKTDGNLSLVAGTITVKMTGKGGKGIKSDGTFTMGRNDQTGPMLTVTTSGSSVGGTSSGGWGGGPGGMGQESGGSGSAKAVKVQGTVTLYGGESTIETATDGAEGLESKTAVYIEGGKHYLKCYDDCINSSGNIYINGGITICYSYGNDAVDSNAGKAGALTIGNGTLFAYTTKGAPEEGLDCDNNSYIQITGTGIAISAGGAQGGGSSSSSISNAKQGYYFYTSTISYSANRYYTLSDESGNNLVTYSFPASISSSMSLFTATGMKSNSKYYVKYATSAPTDATTSFHGLYLGSSAKGTTSVCSFTAK